MAPRGPLGVDLPQLPLPFHLWFPNVDVRPIDGFARCQQSGERFLSALFVRLFHLHGNHTRGFSQKARRVLAHHGTPTICFPERLRDECRFCLESRLLFQ